ncbi:MAG TPA: ABC transporter substrate-binding protein [Pseudomonadota bacterium]|nr:ABC transporter substrate-binding protein [Pseudomonadota bacterium]
MARAQQSMPVVGFLNGASPDGFASEVAAFRQGLNEAGYVEGQNVAIEFRWAEFQNDRLPALAADLIRRQVAVIIASGGDVTAHVAKTATTTIPIVFVSGEPIESGLVAALNRPGGNLTGVSLFAVTLASKQLELLHEAAPKAAVIGVFVNPREPEFNAQTREVEAAARALGLTVHVVQVDSDDHNFDDAFTTLRKKSVDALLVVSNFAFFGQRNLLVAAAARHAIPTMYFRREFVPAGGLISYGTNVPDSYRQVGLYTGRILKGAKPADLPVLQPIKYEFVINLKTAKVLGLEIPPKVLALADEVIE